MLILWNLQVSTALNFFVATSIFRLICFIFLELDKYSVLYLYEQCRLLGPSELQFVNQFSVKNFFFSKIM